MHRYDKKVHLQVFHFNRAKVWAVQNKRCLYSHFYSFVIDMSISLLCWKACRAQAFAGW